jgi:hypothetical protein
MAKRDLIAIQRQILDAQEALAWERACDVHAARESVRLLLGQHGLFTASFAMRCNAAGEYLEFDRMAGALRAGGFHRVRLTGGRSIDG